MSIDLKVVGRRVKLYRKQVSLTQEELSGITEISVQHISGVENGQAMSLASFIRICKALNISLDDLFCELVPQSSGAQRDELSELQKDFSNKEKLMLLDYIELVKKSRKY